MASISSSSTSPSASKPHRILACVLCQHRKIKCDRNFPCSNCTKANVKCTPSTPAPARKRRRPNQDLQERLARCEELLKEYATTDKQPDTPTAKPIQSAAYDDPYLKWQPKGKLVQEDGGVRFMDSFLLGTVYDELRAMREIVDADETEDCSPDTMTPDGNSDLILGGESPSHTSEDLWPEPAQVFRLWQIYLDKVNPLTKIIHVPTLQPYLAVATTGSHNVPKNIEALLFAIFLMAVVASSEDECTIVLGYSKSKAIQRFSSGVRLSLMRMGFLKTHDLTTLQALVVYVMSLQGRYNRHAAWILNGVVIRIAQKMGLHRDGEILGLGPFDTEMRRRLWWQVIMLDAKYAMLSGLSHSLLPRSWDTKEPKNLNDADLYPSATEPFQNRDGPTEMIFCLICYRVAKFLTQAPGFETMIMVGELEAMEHENSDGPSQEQLSTLRRTVEDLAMGLLDLLDQYCDPTAGPVHQMAILMKDHIIDKLQELITPPKDQPEWGTEVNNPKDNAFKVAVGGLENAYNNYTSAENKGFLWWSLLHFQVDVFIYTVGQLCYRTDGSLVERAWKAVDALYQYHTELFDVSNKTYFTLSLFLLKAWRRRRQVLIAKGEPAEAPFYVAKLLEVMPPQDDDKTDWTPCDSTSQQSQQMDQLDLSPFMAQGNTPDPAVDQLLGGYLDPASLEWGDMFNMPLQLPMGTHQTQHQNLGGQPQMVFGYGMAPSEW